MPKMLPLTLSLLLLAPWVADAYSGRDAVLVAVSDTVVTNERSGLAPPVALPCDSPTGTCLLWVVDTKNWSVTPTCSFDLRSISFDGPDGDHSYVSIATATVNPALAGERWMTTFEDGAWTDWVELGKR